jgi:transcriptional antiterminator NusG
MVSEEEKQMWYVVQSAEGKETAAVEKCRKAIPSHLAGAIFSPRYEFMRRYQGAWHTKEGILFPGYIFVESDRPAELGECLGHISGVVAPVCIGGGFFPIRQDEEEFLRSMLDETYCIRYSVGYIVEGELLVESGPLLGKTERITRIDRHRRVADMVLSLFREEKKVQVGLKVPGKMTAEEYREMKATA